MIALFARGPDSGVAMQAPNRRRRITTAAALAGALAAPGVASADRIERGVVVALEAGEAYFDLGRASGLTRGRPLRVKRAVALPHPVTGKTVRDELLVGTGTVTLVGETLSMVVLGPELDANIGVGDVVEVLVESTEPAPAPMPVEPPPPLPSVPTTPPATAVALEVWGAGIGAEVDVKIASWERYLADFPDSPHAVPVRGHLTALRELRDHAPSRLVEGEARVTGIAHLPLVAAAVGERIPIALAVRRPERLLGAWLHYRRSGDDGYRRVELVRDGDGYLRGDIPPSEVRDPGVEYFVEVATAEGRAGVAVGSPQKPVEVAVDAPDQGGAFRERKNRSRVSMSTEYLEYSTFDDRADGDQHRDVFFSFETDFLFRLRSRYLYGIRVGLGVINGEGGFADEPMSESAGFNFGYTEVELRVFERSAVLARAVAGIGKDGLGFGIEGRLRLGAEEESNLTVAASSLEDIGFLSEVRMQWAAIRRMPLGFSVGVTDQPNRGDLGVRLGADIGWRAMPWFQPTLRVSYQGRSLDHSGVGFGAGMVFDW